MVTFVAVYRGPTVSAAKLVALSADPELVEEFIATLLPTGSKSAREDAEPRSNSIVNEQNLDA